MIEHHRQGAFSVRHDPTKPGAPTFSVFFDYGHEHNEQPLVVPPRTPHGKHPAYAGQEVRYGWDFRTKTGARRYMQAVAESGILPEDRPATVEEIRALRDWIESEAAG